MESPEATPTQVPVEQLTPDTAPEQSTQPEQAAAPVTKNASWGVIISITIILAMIIVGAFYSWGQRIAEQHPQTIQQGQ